jgi:hypothetical protein
MGQVPAGFRFPDTLDQYGVPHGEADASTLANGLDFWWDEFATNRWNCWFDNTGPDGSAGSVTGPGDAGRLPGAPPNLLPDCAGGTNPDSSVGLGDAAKEQYLVDCAEGPDEETGPLDCDWWTPPNRPGSTAASAHSADVAEASEEFADSPEGRAMQRRMEALAAGAGG